MNPAPTLPALPVDGPPSPGGTAKVHLNFLDGIRGLSAFYVVLHHVYLMLLYAGVGEGGGIAGRLMSGLRPLAFGRYAVDMFIVLSGYCLMLPAVRGTNGLKGGFKGYLLRRARRILPPYIAALGVSLLVIWLVHPWVASVKEDNEIAWNLPGTGDLLAHVFLVHNLVNVWSHSINAPMWSVATEWQIYFLFPLVLLPLWKRLGIVAAVAAAFLLGFAADGLTPGGLGGAAPWLAGLFALGMMAAAINFSTGPRIEFFRERIPWGMAALLLAILLAVAGTIVRGWFREHPQPVDSLFGVAAMCLLVFSARANRSTMPAHPWLLRILNGRFAVVLGAFSYSLYLTHRPLLDIATLLLFRTPLSSLARIALTFLVYAPLAVGFAYLFHLVFERPFMPGRPRSLARAIVAAEGSPAP